MPSGAVRVRVPASSANLGPGFDSIGLALGIWDEYDVSITAEPGLVIEVIGEGAAQVPRDERHLVYRSMVAAWRHLGVAIPSGVHLVARNVVPHGRGLGSSATAIVAGVAAAGALADRYDVAVVNDLSARLEGHPDNSSASVHGGLTLSWQADAEEPVPGMTRTVSLPLHPDIDAVVFVPETRLSTEVARKALPASVPHRDAAQNSARAALFVAAATHRPDLLLPATRDWLHQEARRSAFAASMDLVDHLRGQGHAAVISGAGPCVLVLTTRAVIDRVTADPLVWRRLLPGIPDRGVDVTTLAR
jgi:homoserine kinase